MLSRLDIYSLVAALTLHGAVAGFVLVPAPTSPLPPQQIIEVRLVAPSIVQTKKPEPEKTDKSKELATVSSSPERTAAALKKNPKNPSPPKKTHQQKERLTSGQSSPSGKDLTSAYTKHVAARYLNNPAPPYPHAARRQKQQGTVLLDVYVSAQGKPRRVRILRSSGFQLLDQTALSTVRRWSFVPARRGRKAVGGRVRVPITFRIR